MSDRKVVVTGASGMVGYHVVKHLSGRGWRVVALVRASSNTASLSALAAGAGKVNIATAELSDRGALVKAMTGAEAVVHAAGSVDPFGRRQDVMAVNVGGTRSCLEAAVAAGVKHFLQISSLSVITGQGDQFGLKDDAPLRYCGESYADSKVDAEKVVMAEQSGQRIQVTALRPGFIYGPQERAWMPRLINSLAT